MLATETTATSDFMPPLPLALAGLSTPELLKVVLEEVGEGCGLNDFREHAATCHFTEDQVKANIGAAKRLLLLDRAETAGPAAPLAPWDADPSYRAELVKEGGRIAALAMADTAAIVGRLEANAYDPRAMCALWDDIITEAIRAVHTRPAVAPMARAIADLEAALDAYHHPDNNAEARQLTRSMRVALQAMRGEATIARDHVVQTVTAFASALDWGGFGDRTHTDKVKAAVATLRKIWGL